MSEQLQKFYTRKEIAVLLGVRHETVSRWASAGLFPSAIRVGKRVLRYDLNEVLNSLKNNKIDLTPIKNNEWLPIETAPIDGTKFLAYIPERDDVFAPDIQTLYHTGKLIAGFTNGYYIQYKPTHWMPLPKPPQTKYVSGEICFNPNHFRPLPEPPSKN